MMQRHFDDELRDLREKLIYMVEGRIVKHQFDRLGQQGQFVHIGRPKVHAQDVSSGSYLSQCLLVDHFQVTGYQGSSQFLFCR